MFIRDLKKVCRNFIIFNRNTGLEYLYSDSLYSGSKSNQFDHLEILEMYPANEMINVEVDAIHHPEFWWNNFKEEKK